MIELVQIAPGVVYSPDVLGVAWLRKHHGDHLSAGEAVLAPPNGQWVASATERIVATPEAPPFQMSLL
ncbi:hypothetical protein [Burkholderia sp. Ed8]|uniref:hypothetical protein n=1 Tax=Burkholderia sp. Ed8 TaxID=3112957 RepID=UPI00345D8B90